jgi:hypothetical protein
MQRLVAAPSDEDVHHNALGIRLVPLSRSVIHLAPTATVACLNRPITPPHKALDNSQGEWWESFSAPIPDGSGIVP